jgi:hypothetical protein
MEVPEEEVRSSKALRGFECVEAEEADGAEGEK